MGVFANNVYAYANDVVVICMVEFIYLRINSLMVKPDFYEREDC